MPASSGERVSRELNGWAAEVDVAGGGLRGDSVDCAASLEVGDWSIRKRGEEDKARARGIRTREHPLELARMVAEETRWRQRAQIISE